MEEFKTKIGLRILLVKFATAIKEENAEDTAQCEANILNFFITSQSGQLTTEIKGIEINEIDYRYFVSDKLRVNEIIPNDEIWVYNTNGTIQKFKIV